MADGKPKLKGEMWFLVTDLPVFAVAGFWQQAKEGTGFAMVTFDPNKFVAPIHPKAMITVLLEADQDGWLNGTLKDVFRLHQPYGKTLMIVRGPVFPRRKLYAAN